MIRRLCCLFALALAASPNCAADKGELVCDYPKDAKFKFGGVIGERIDANIENWLLKAPISNPGMIEMFRVRDRQPPPNIVPWAGEFVGKYLISAIQAMRMTDDPRLEKLVRQVIADLLACQAEDGYLGPFPKDQRLLGNWDLWGHYHVMLALLMWHERAGDKASLDACKRMADLVCKTYLNTNRRIYDAGSHEMNMAIIHSLGWLFRVTKEPRYVAMMKEIETDWQRAGDYYRTGLAGVPFFRTPRPRWESLHDVQGLMEFFQIKGDARYRDAFLKTWSSIRDWDARNTGGFSSGEQATGDPYENSAIETCCSIAWMAMSIDALRLTGDPQIADAIEINLYNAICGAQHSSGRWWTYNTPMDGVREASAHSIVFQSRAGAPELNCCSVNGPRGLGMLSEWAVVLKRDDLILNYLGPMVVDLEMPDGKRGKLRVETEYPFDGRIRVYPAFDSEGERTIAVRIPGWATRATVEGPLGSVRANPGQYAMVKSNWRKEAPIHIEIDLRLWTASGDLDQIGKVSIYRGPLLLAYDQADNEMDENALPTIDIAKLRGATFSPSHADSSRLRLGNTPWLFVDVPVGQGRLRLRDFASAGGQGTRYRSWLAASNTPPPTPRLTSPTDGARLPVGPIVFRWRPASAGDSPTSDTLSIRLDGGSEVVLETSEGKSGAFILTADDAGKLTPGKKYSWRVRRNNSGGQRESFSSEHSFTIDPSLPPLGPEELTEFGERADGVVIDAKLAGNLDPTWGKLANSKGASACAGPNGDADHAIELKGERPIVAYTVKRFPEESYSAAVWVNVTDPPKRMAQVVSAWCKGGDDPLRISVENGQILARIEGGGLHTTPGVPMPLKKWVHVALVKERGKLRLYLDGKQVAEAGAPTYVRSGSAEIAVGGNPKFSGDESLPGKYTDFRLYARALSRDEVARLAQEK